jgi:hypothetical protein
MMQHSGIVSRSSQHLASMGWNPPYLPDPMKIRVVLFEQCRQQNCPVGMEHQTLKDFHLVVTRREVELREGVAAAISYTWGEFDREKVAIGHSKDGVLVTLELGQEWWPREELMKRLIDLSEENGALWMDQLCVPQKGDALRALLAKISLVYRTLFVHILLPGSLCKCLAEWLNRHQLMELVKNERILFHHLHEPIWQDGFSDELEDEFKRLITSCVNAVGACSYFERMWTVHEIDSARRFRVTWASTKVQPCLKVGDAVEEVLAPNGQGRSVNPYLHNFISKSLATGEQSRIIRFEVKRVINRWLSNQYAAFLESFFPDPGLTEYLTSRFLLGLTFSRKSENDVEEDWTPVPTWDGDQLERFRIKLITLRDNFAKTTEERDYVLSVWTLCPGYKIPEGFRQMNVQALLEDALVQFECAYGYSLPILAPSGIFDAHISRGSALFRPTTCLREADITHIGVLYKRFATGFLEGPRLTDGHIKLALNGNGEQFSRQNPMPSLTTDFFDLFEILSQSASPAETINSALERADVRCKFTALDPGAMLGQGSSPLLQLNLIRTVFQAWPVLLQNVFDLRCRKQQVVGKNAVIGQVCVERFLAFLNQTTADDAKDADFLVKLFPYMGSDLIFSLVAETLGLNPEACSKCNLRLMICFTEAGPVIGISRRRYPWPIQALEPRLQEEDLKRPLDNLTVHMAGGTHSDVWACYETDLVDGGAKPPTYRVSGAWIYAKDILPKMISARCDPNGTDAIIL